MTSNRSSANRGVLIISHGSKDAKWVKQVDEAIAPLHRQFPFPIETSFLELVPGRLIQDGIDRLEAIGVTEIAAIPLFVCSGSTHIEELRQAFRVPAILHEKVPSPSVQPFRIQARVKFGVPMDANPFIVHILYEHFERLRTNEEDSIVLIIGHGSRLPGFYEIWEQVLHQIGANLQAKGSIKMVKTAMLAANQVSEVLEDIFTQVPHAQPIVLPLFLSEGYFTKVAIPKRLAGFPVRYDGRTLLPNDRITKWLAEQIERL